MVSCRAITVLRAIFRDNIVRSLIFRRCFQRPRGRIENTQQDDRLNMLEGHVFRMKNSESVRGWRVRSGGGGDPPYPPVPSQNLATAAPSAPVVRAVNETYARRPRYDPRETLPLRAELCPLSPDVSLPRVDGSETQVTSIFHSLARQLQLLLFSESIRGPGLMNFYDYASSPQRATVRPCETYQCSARGRQRIGNAKSRPAEVAFEHRSSVAHATDRLQLRSVHQRPALVTGRLRTTSAGVDTCASAPCQMNRACAALRRQTVAYSAIDRFLATHDLRRLGSRPADRARAKESPQSSRVYHVHSATTSSNCLPFNHVVAAVAVTTKPIRHRPVRDWTP